MASRKDSVKDMLRRERSAFTIIELLVVTAMIGVLVTMLVPAVNSARESSRKAACQSNLRQFGLGMMVYAENHQGKYCSGAFDWLRDGCVTQRGWVADLVNQGIPVGKMLCPSNAGLVAETFNDLLNAPTSISVCVDLIGGESKMLPDGTEDVNPCRQIITSSLQPGSESRRRLVEERILEKFFNTNYTASWLLVRSRPLLDGSGNIVSRKAGCSNSIDSLSATAGPLNQSAIDASKVPASNVPMLGCGRTTGSLAQDLGDHPAGTFTTRSFTAGPLLASTGETPKFPMGASRQGRDGWWAVWTKRTVQDYRGFAPVHRSVCNVLMADGSVRPFEDANRDGFLHNGFPVPAGSGDGDDRNWELPPNDVFSGAALRGL